MALLVVLRKLFHTSAFCGKLTKNNCGTRTQLTGTFKIFYQNIDYVTKFVRFFLIRYFKLDIFRQKIRK
jgi:hypothetical protein